LENKLFKKKNAKHILFIWQSNALKYVSAEPTSFTDSGL